MKSLRAAWWWSLAKSTAILYFIINSKYFEDDQVHFLQANLI